MQRIRGASWSRIRWRRVCVATALDYLLANFTGLEVKYVHVTHNARMRNEHDVVFQNYCTRLCFDGEVSEGYQHALMDFRGLKIIINARRL